MKKHITALVFAALVFSDASLTAARADSTFITFSVNMATNIANGSFLPGADIVEVAGTFNGWGALPMIQQGASTIYTNTVEDTSDSNGGKMEYKFVINGANWEYPATGQNRAVLLPITNGASLVLPIAFFSDAGAPATYNITFQVNVSEQIALGNFIPGTNSVEVRGMGLPNGWNSGNTLSPDPSILRTNQFGVVTSNVWVGTFSVVGSPGGAGDFKYVIQPGTIWDTPSAVNQDDRGNRYFANVTQTLPVVAFNDAGSTLVSFNVDMSAVAAADPVFNPKSVTVNGDFNNWGAGAPMTNNPAAGNTNLFTTVVALSGGSTVNYQFRYVESNGYTVYDLLNGVRDGTNNRHLLVPPVPNTNVPAVLFNDATLDDYLTRPQKVTFSVDMNGAVGTDGHAFNPAADNVYIYGEITVWYPWSGGVNPSPAPPGYQMIEQGLSTIYTNTLVLPAGTLMAFEYKYGMDPGAFNGGPLDDEAPFGMNHYRVVRSTAIQPYVMATDKFGYQYGEPFFDINEPGGARLDIGSPAVDGTVPVTWLGRPGAHLQVSTNLLTGAWQDLIATDGTNWTSGYSSTNGFVSQTNWPANGTAWFRLTKKTSPIVISNVTPIAPQQTQTITISGHGFGSQNPYTGNSDYLSIQDVTGNWEAGYAPAGNLVTLNVISWTDNQIVIGGFTGDYGTGAPYNWFLQPGDNLTIAVWNAQTGIGPATYHIVVGSL